MNIESTIPQSEWLRMKEAIRACEKREDIVSVYFARWVSKYVSAVLISLGASGNQVTAGWGVLDVATSVAIYYALRGHYTLIPCVGLMYFFSLVLDCSDGEVARYQGTASPIGGKLMDGVSHKAAEYSMLIAYALAAHQSSPEPYVWPLGLLLLAGEAMYNYVEERRILVIRLHAKTQGRITPAGPDEIYRAGEAWGSFSTRKKLKSIVGLLQYKSVYLMIALSYVSPQAFVVGLIGLAVYKHASWLKLVADTVNHPPAMNDERPSHMAAVRS